MKKAVFLFFKRSDGPQRQRQTETAGREQIGQQTDTKKKSKKGGVVVVGGTKVEPSPPSAGVPTHLFRRSWNQGGTISGGGCRG